MDDGEEREYVRREGSKREGRKYERWRGTKNA